MPPYSSSTYQYSIMYAYHRIIILKLLPPGGLWSLVVQNNLVIDIQTATDILVNLDAMVDRLVGDEVVGLFIPGIAGPEHPRRAIQAAQDLLHRTGHRDPGGPWIPLGVGIHTGPAFVGVVGGSDDRPMDFTAFGENVNITARLASEAGTGKILISEAAYTAAGIDLGNVEIQQLEIKGKRDPIGVRVLRIQ